MKGSYILAIPMLIILSIITSCDKFPFDDDQYGDVCNVVEFKQNMEFDNSEGILTIEYDQTDMITEMNYTLTNFPQQKMTVTYNNNTVFADYYLDGKFWGSAEAPVDLNGNIQSCIWYDSLGATLSEQFFYYDENEHLVEINGINQFTNSSASLDIEWTGNNATRFTRTDGPTMTCTYNIGLTSSCKMGKGNTALLFQPVDANIAISFSEDLLKSMTTEGFGEPIYFEYELDDHDKVRIVYWSTESSGIYGSTEISYECHDK